ncbi:ABC transporter permease [Primorskyibacter flagellatus]|uniref:ABC transporter permease n=1 Tax=Primorskyibacter flagellatus TaxID=1387277 RepID=A0A917E8I6_9RHOB|nr:ABC transporter permease [Primorskyibacter flagellatus]GGE15332.1 ABC transporter permease [Primorskyibacter flagellatus]
MLDLLFHGARPARIAFLVWCGWVVIFLVGPLLAIVPLSFNSEPYFTFPMPGLSLQWYRAFFTLDNWRLALWNSTVIGLTVMAVSVLLGTLAALGLHRLPPVASRALTAFMALPMALPLIVTAISVYFAFTRIGLTGTFAGMVLSHTIIATPFVIIAVGASLARFDETLIRAAASLGAGPWRTFWRVRLPLIRPGILNGAIFAFVASFDDLVVTLFVGSTELRTLPRQMWAGVRENLDPTILAVATLLAALSLAITVISLRLIARESRK